MLVGMRSTCARYGFIALACSSILILGCERDSYTSWSCKSPEGIKTAMVLKKAQMLLLEKNFSYCGSLGEKSYFDESCPADIQNSSILFVPVSGALQMNHQEYRCDVL